MKIYDFDGQGQDSVSFGNVADIIESRTTHRVQPIHQGVNYHAEPLEFKLVFGACDPLDRFDMERIAMWLTGYQDYQWLSIAQSDLEHVQFRCLVTELTPIYNIWIPYAFTATFVCDCPYAYGLPFEKRSTISGKTTINVDNDTSVREYLKPKIIFQKSAGVTELKVINKSDNNREFILTDLPAAAMEITIDNNNGIITHNAGDVNVYNGFNGKLFRMVPGVNQLEVTGNGTFTITGRTLHNVGA